MDANMPATTMRAKMIVVGVTTLSESTERLAMNPVTGKAAFPPSGESEDSTYARWTPTGSLSLDITNPNLHGKFALGDKFYVDFTKADE